MLFANVSFHACLLLASVN